MKIESCAFFTVWYIQMKVPNFYMRGYTSGILLGVTLAWLAACNQPAKRIISTDTTLVGIVGYGSLLSRTSMEETLGRSYNDSTYSVHLLGFAREWTDLTLIEEFEAATGSTLSYLEGNDTLAFDGIISLNVRAKKDSKINCILYTINKSDLLKFDEREFGYERIDVSNDIEELYFPMIKVYIYKTLPVHEYETGRKGKFIIEQAYLNLINKACDSLGTAFKAEYNSSTIPFDTTILVKPVIELEPTVLNIRKIEP